MDTKILAIVLLIIGVVALGSYYHFNPNEIEVEKIVEVCPEDDIAILDVKDLGQFENIDDPTEMFFDYRIDNYGKAEGRNIKVTCDIRDRNDNVVSVVTDNYGNLASNQYDTAEVVTDNIPFSSYKDGTAGCYVESCDNCKILIDEIPELKEFYRK